ncbi:unnamed protein product [Leptidea sinapis]|uniref:Protein crumbs n=1 Tax=Leptidea sinapis TaxID=189913 RepID=A0A5E4PQ05_9NEOP|nr:unnamed protein product [Leptidea sinapis]
MNEVSQLFGFLERVVGVEVKEKWDFLADTVSVMESMWYCGARGEPRDQSIVTQLLASRVTSVNSTHDHYVISNVTWNPELLSPGALEAGGAVLLVGNLFSGCVHEGPQLEFHAQYVQHTNVTFGSCPLTTDECKDRKDVLRIPPKDHCYNEPCLRHGTCISRHDKYVINCRYSGHNCEVDVDECSDGVDGGAKCLNGGRCVDAANNYTCDCTGTGYRGARCELNVNECEQEGAVCGHGVCYDTYGSFMSACASGPCGAGGACVEENNGAGFRCVCARGLVPPLCAPAVTPAAACADVTCPPRSHCKPGAPGASPNCTALENVCESGAGVCHNGGSCVRTPHGFNCTCPPPYRGVYCEIGPAGKALSDLKVERSCASAPCAHATACRDTTNGFRCECEAGWTGARCDSPAGAAEPDCYTGDSCEQDIDECLSSPCKNGGTCQNLENNYECACVEGFEGKDCSSNINECASNPCALGSTCVDGVASKNCDIDIEECESSPCQHEGVCLERSNASLYRSPEAAPERVGPQPHMLLPQYFYQPFSVEVIIINLVQTDSLPNNKLYNLYHHIFNIIYTVQIELRNLEPTVSSIRQDGAAAGYLCVCVEGTSGARCEINVDECASSPCGHGKCVDGIGAYRCECAPGYEGDHCEIEIDECLRYTPCSHGRCFDGRASYVCACEAGWGGRNCSVLLTGCHDQPCANRGTCLPWLFRETDHRFNCTCAPGFYGHTCEQITTMSLERSSYVEVNTSREEGYDISFRFKTTLGSGLLAMGRGLTYFFLELSNGRLNLHSSLLNKWEGVFIGSNLNDSEWQKVFVTINASHVVLSANEEQTIYPISQNEAFNASVTSFPSTRLGAPGSSFATLTHGPNFFVGCFQDVVVNQHWVIPEESNTTTAEYSTERSGDWSEGEGEGEGSGEAAEGEEGGARVSARGVVGACPRRPQCEPNPCRSGGACEDAWTSFVCSCPRPYLGDTCQYSYVAATFGHEGATKGSVVVVTVGDTARRGVHAALDISMFIRTRKPTGQIFYLGSASSAGSGGRDREREETLVGGSLKGGELLVHLRFNHTPEDYTVGGTRLDNGHLHLIQVVRNSTLVQVKLNGTEYFRKSISAAKQLDAQVLYLGGPPPRPSAVVSPAPAPGPANETAEREEAGPPDYDEADYFKGVIQDVQISNGVNVTIGCLGAVHVGSLLLPYFTEQELFVGAAAALLAAQPHYALISGSPWGWQSGVGCALCLEQECAHGGHCRDMRNSYTCDCPPGFRGDQCEVDIDECEQHECQNGATCMDDLARYVCICPPGYEGTLCERDVDECESGPCQNGGQCVNVAGSFHCECSADCYYLIQSITSFIIYLKYHQKVLSEAPFSTKERQKKKKLLFFGRQNDKPNTICLKFD